MHAPINPNASTEAKDLLAFFYAMKGRYTLSGQHNQMHHMSDISDQVAQISGKTPLVWGGEWGFSDARHNIDNIAFRPWLLEEIRRQHGSGRIICLTWHQAAPTVGEPCEFVGGVQTRLTDAEWDELETEGSPLHSRWLAMVDLLAEALLQIQSERIPVVFRPYHEMNGEWFWWGGLPDRFLVLWRAIYDRYTNHFGINNLLWSWNPDKPYPGVEAYFPGIGEVDLLGTDIYPSAERAETYPQEWFDRMHQLAGEKPMGLSEMSELPTDALLATQPYDWFMSWDNLVFKANTEEQIRQVFQSPRILSEM